LPRPGRGYFINKRRQVFTKTERLRRLDETIDLLISQSVALDFSASEVLDRVKELFAQKLSVAPE
jgi:GntR family transcriptional regulator